MYVFNGHMPGWPLSRWSCAEMSQSGLKIQLVSYIGFAGGCYCIFIKPRSMETVVAACLGPAHVSMDTVMV